eukprot:1156566-Pelagomonas_calceolata.AAC.3
MQRQQGVQACTMKQLHHSTKRPFPASSAPNRIMAGGASGADGEGGGFGAGLMRKARRVSALFMDPSALASLGQGVVGSKAGHNRRASMESMAGNEKSGAQCCEGMICGR